MTFGGQPYRFDATPLLVSSYGEQSRSLAPLPPMERRSYSGSIAEPYEYDLPQLELPRTYEEDLDEARKCLQTAMQVVIQHTGSTLPTQKTLIAAAKSMHSSDPLRRSVAALFIDSRTRDKAFLMSVTTYLEQVSSADYARLKKVRLDQYRSLQPLLKTLAQKMARLATHD